MPTSSKPSLPRARSSLPARIAYPQSTQHTRSRRVPERSKTLRQILSPFRPHAVAERFAGARHLRERLLAAERDAGVDDHAPIAPVVGGIVAHRVERR